MKQKTVLISGGAIAGLTLAFWLKKYGFTPTLIERSGRLPQGGYKVDIRGAALEVIKQMGIYDKIVESQTDIQEAAFVDEKGCQITQMSGDDFGFRVSEDLEIMRGDLCRILQGAAGDVEFLFGDSISALEQGPESVKVRFEKNRPRTFDFVIGADGLHSQVRKLVFGDESQFLQELGLYISIFTVPNFWGLDRKEIEFNEGDRLINIYSSKGDANAKAAFLFASKHLDFDPRNVDEQQKLLADAYAGVNWEAPRLLEAMKDAPDFYFDSVAKICMNRWSKGRVALVGDAAYSASPASGQGTSLALVGAYVLAKEMAAKSSDPIKAFGNYEKRLNNFVAKNQKLADIFAKNMTGENKIMSWLRKIIPGKWAQFMTNRAVDRVYKAARAIKL